MMKKHMSQDEILKMKTGIFLVWEGLQLIEDTKDDFEERTDYDIDTMELTTKIDEMQGKIFNLEEEYIPKHDYFKDPVRSVIVQMLASDLDGMVELDEVNMTFEKIKKVMDWKLTQKDKEYLNDILNSIENRSYEKEMKEFLFSNKFLDSHFFKPWRDEK